MFTFVFFFLYFRFLFYLPTTTTAFLRLEVMIQEQKLHELRESLQKLTDLNRKCDRLRKKDRKFLQMLIETSRNDNVPLTETQCLSFCSKNKVKDQDCDALCSPKFVRCAHWPDSSKCLKHEGSVPRSFLEDMKKAKTKKKRHKRNAEPTLAQTVVLTTPTRC